MEIVTLVGSSRFKDRFHIEGARLEKQGNLVLMMSFFQHADTVRVSEEDRVKLRLVDRKRIDLCNWVFVINCRVPWCNLCENYRPCKCESKWEGLFRPYIGEDTKIEISYAYEKKKVVNYLFPIDYTTEAKFSDELCLTESRGKK